MISNKKVVYLAGLYGSKLMVPEASCRETIKDLMSTGAFDHSETN